MPLLTQSQQGTTVQELLNTAQLPAAVRNHKSLLHRSKHSANSQTFQQKLKKIGVVLSCTLKDHVWTQRARSDQSMLCLFNDAVSSPHYRLLILHEKYRGPFPAAIPSRVWENSRVAHVNAIPAASVERKWSDKIMTMYIAICGSSITYRKRSWSKVGCHCTAYGKTGRGKSAKSQSADQQLHNRPPGMQHAQPNRTRRSANHKLLQSLKH